jgi:hypothetical protein
MRAYIWKKLREVFPTVGALGHADRVAVGIVAAAIHT